MLSIICLEKIWRREFTLEDPLLPSKSKLNSHKFTKQLTLNKIYISMCYIHSQRPLIYNSALSNSEDSDRA